MVTTHPILFSGEMVRAILDGSKVQTRRIIKPQPDTIHDAEPYWSIGGYRAWQYRGITDPLHMGTANPLICRYGKVGDRLWVKHPHKRSISSDRQVVSIWDKYTLRHRFSDPNCLDIRRPEALVPSEWKNMPGMLMPRWASRISLEITDIRVQRLQDISEEDAKAEGVSVGQRGVAPGDATLCIHCGASELRHIGVVRGCRGTSNVFDPSTYRGGFYFLWEQLNGRRDNGKYAWAENPWVWALSFQKVDQDA